MARPRKNNADYFSHDNNMRNHRKIKAVRNKFGLEGYAIYNMFLETLTEADNFRIKIDEEMEWDLLAADFGVDKAKLKEVLNYFQELKLFLYDKKTGFFSDGLEERLSSLVEKREYFRKKYAEKVVSTEETEFHKVEMPQTKLNKIKLNKTKEEKLSSDSVPPKKTYHNFLNQRRIESGRAPIPKKKPTEKQLKAIKRMKSLDYFHKVGIENGFEYLAEEDDQANRKFQGLARSFEKRFGDRFKEVIDWWFAENNAWCDYHPSNFFAIGTFMKFENKDKADNEIIS